jgi:hypothetical protein
MCTAHTAVHPSRNRGTRLYRLDITDKLVPDLHKDYAEHIVPLSVPHIVQQHNLGGSLDLADPPHAILRRRVNKLPGYGAAPAGSYPRPAHA